MSSGASGGAAQTGVAQTPQSQAVQSGAIGAGGIKGGSSTPVFQWLSPQANASVDKATNMSFDDWLKTLGSAVQSGATQRSHAGDAQAGMASFQNPQAAQTQHQIGIGTILSML